jgi:hypothetical protein
MIVTDTTYLKTHQKSFTDEFFPTAFFIDDQFFM